MADPENSISKLSDIAHVLHAGDFYVGQDIQPPKMSVPVVRPVLGPEGRMELKTVQYPKGLLKMVDEALVNAADNRYKGTRNIRVTVNRMQGSITVWNDGPNFRVIETKEASGWDPAVRAWQPEIAFFQMRTSSAYRKRRKVTGGKYGLGAKLVSILSLHSQLDMSDGTKRYVQRTSDHMQQVFKPSIHPVTVKQAGKPYLKLTFVPDLKLFYPAPTPPRLTDQMVALIKTRVWEIAGTTPKEVKVKWNLVEDAMGSKGVKPVRVPVSDFKQLIKLFLPANSPFAFFRTERWSVGLARSPFETKANVSFVNHINTYMEGQHVSYLGKQLAAWARTKVPGLDGHRISQATVWFVNSTIEDASFNNQSKETLITIPAQFGSTCVLPTSFFNVLVRDGTVDLWKRSMESKALAKVRKEVGAGKRKSVMDIVKLRDAHKAGTRESHKCTLYLVEGDSAMELADVGRSVVGSKYMGAFPLKGKLKNADCNAAALVRNKEIRSIFRIMGLELGKPMARSQLRYGKLVIMTDADDDGHHIKGLLIFLFHRHWPNLLVEGNFLVSMITPIVVITHSTTKKVQRFYTVQAFKRWHAGLSDSQRSRYHVKYYKGLGTSTKKEGKYYFQNLRQHLCHFRPSTPEDHKMIEHAFSKKDAAFRKQWIPKFDPSAAIPYGTVRQISYSDFLDHDWLKYSWASIRRNLPLCEDGLTVAARKCLWTFLAKNINKDVKVSHLQTVVSKFTNYHHGADSLGKVIVRMSQQFPGKQNLNLFVPSGQFGSRRDGGQSPAASRYINSRVQPIARTLFMAADDPILTLRTDEGMDIEPRAMAPIIPQLLVNGAKGTATAYSCAVPCYKPEDLIGATLRALDGKAWISLQPWYDKFTGTVTGDAKGNWTSTGTVKQTGPLEWRIVELPLGTWIDVYKQRLVGMVKAGLIDKFLEDHREEAVNFTLKLKEALPADTDPIKAFKLTSTFKSQLNLIVLGPTDVAVRTFESIEAVFMHWFKFRSTLYEQRRLSMVARIQQQIPAVQARIDFVRYVIGHGQSFLGKKRKAMEQQLQAEAKSIGSEYYPSLLSMKLSSLTEEKISALNETLAQLARSLELYRTVHYAELWRKDLAALAAALPAFYENRRELD